MLFGRYVGSQMRPMIEGRISIPSIGAGGFVQFLIDTGADCTTLTPNSARMIRVNYNKLTVEDHSMGYSGTSSDFICPAIISFSEIDVVEYEYDIELRITKPDPGMPELLVLPPLLGRDILNRWRLMLDPKAKKIAIDVLSSDREERDAI
jgi:hypothetical protein